MALGVSVALMMTITTVVEYTSSNSRWSSYSRANVSAYSLAEAGMNDARSVLWKALNPRDPSSVPQTIVNLDGGKATFSGVYDDPTSTWTLTSIGSVTNPNGTVEPSCHTDDQEQGSSLDGFDRRIERHHLELPLYGHAAGKPVYDLGE